MLSPLSSISNHTVQETKQGRKPLSSSGILIYFQTSPHHFIARYKWYPLHVFEFRPRNCQMSKGEEWNPTATPHSRPERQDAQLSSRSTRCRNGSDMNPTDGFSMAIGLSQALRTLRSADGRISITSPSTSTPISSQSYLARRYSDITSADFIAFSIFMLTAATCLSLSATYHTLMNHSQHIERFCLRLDMLGIVIFILGDLVLGIYMVFWCEPSPRNIYWTMVS